MTDSPRNPDQPWPRQEYEDPHFHDEDPERAADGASGVELVKKKG